MPHRIARFQALTRTERLLLLRAFIWLALVDVVLRVDTRRRLIRRNLKPIERGEGSVPLPALQQAERYAHWIEVASRYHLVHARCLHQALVLNEWLRHDGLAADLRIGVRKQDGSFRAHAWVELDGHVINDDVAAVSFTPLHGAAIERDSRAHSARSPLDPRVDFAMLLPDTKRERRRG